MVIEYGVVACINIILFRSKIKKECTQYIKDLIKEYDYMQPDDVKIIDIAKVKRINKIHEEMVK